MQQFFRVHAIECDTEASWDRGRAIPIDTNGIAKTGAKLLDQCMA